MRAFAKFVVLKSLPLKVKPIARVQGYLWNSKTPPSFRLSRIIYSATGALKKSKVGSGWLQFDGSYGFECLFHSLAQILRAVL